MGRRRKYLGILSKITLPLIIMVILVLVAGCSTAQEPQPSASNAPSAAGNGSVVISNGLTQTSAGGAVEIQVKWLVDMKDSLVFDVSMNTHSVDLDKYDLKQLIVLHDSQGNEYQPLSWNSAAGGHHRSGKLIFAVPSSLNEGGTKFLHMVIRNVAGVGERSLEWELG